MISTAQSYHDALLALSSNRELLQAREALLASISNEELIGIITYSVRAEAPREYLDTITTQLFDGLATSQKTVDAIVPARGEHKDEAEGESNANTKTTATRSRRVQRTRAAKHKATQKVAVRATRSSLASQKRRRGAFREARKRMRSMSTDSQDNGDLITQESSGEGDESSEAAEVDFKQPSNAASDTYNGTSMGSGSDSPWKITQQASVMPDLNLVDSDDDEDEDKRHDTGSI